MICLQTQSTDSSLHLATGGGQWCWRKEKANRTESQQLVEKLACVICLTGEASEIIRYFLSIELTVRYGAITRKPTQNTLFKLHDMPATQHTYRTTVSMARHNSNVEEGWVL